MAQVETISIGFQTQQIKLAHRSIINSKGCVSAKLTIPTTTTNISQSISTHFLVVPLEHVAILGKAWLTTMENPDIDWTRNIVNLHKPVPMTLLGEHHQNAKFLISSMLLKKAIYTVVFRPNLDKFVMVYFDDILIFSGSLEEHELHIREVLNVLRQKRESARNIKADVSDLVEQYEHEALNSQKHGS
jgi:hypothetical protein